MREVYEKNWGRAFLKIALIAVFFAVLGCGIDILVHSPFITRVKFNLTFASLIGLVFAVNVLSLFCFGVLYLAYQWVRRDLKAPRRDETLSFTDDE